VTLVYAYGLGVPILLWIALRYLGVGEWSMVEAVAIWGYGQFVWIPVSVLPFSTIFRAYSQTVIDSLRYTALHCPGHTGRYCLRSLGLFPGRERVSYPSLSAYEYVTSSSHPY
jgi:hypothetical protein